MSDKRVKFQENQRFSFLIQHKDTRKFRKEEEEEDRIEIFNSMATRKNKLTEGEN